MSRTRKNHSKEFKAKVALEAVKGLRSLSELGARYKIHPTQIAQWKKQLLENAPVVFERGRTRDSRSTFASTTTNAHTAHWPTAHRQGVTRETEEKGNPPRVLGSLRSGLALRAFRLAADTASAPRPPNAPAPPGP